MKRKNFVFLLISSFKEKSFHSHTFPWHIIFGSWKLHKITLVINIERKFYFLKFHKVFTLCTQIPSALYQVTQRVKNEVINFLFFFFICDNFINMLPSTSLKKFPDSLYRDNDKRVWEEKYFPLHNDVYSIEINAFIHGVTICKYSIFTK
jgi:hypothetical protein